mmetsp:Transcript_38835/g.59036  ORF Transcript_38835/g.59036 Transcript_38835/m.59036 type:complete len:103 (-) Transcript_38835:23-331(-)
MSSEISDVHEIALKTKNTKKKSSDNLCKQINFFGFEPRSRQTLRKNKLINLKKGTARFGDNSSDERRRAPRLNKESTKRVPHGFMGSQAEKSGSSFGSQFFA